MKTETLQFAGYGNTDLCAMLWIPESPPRAVLQIAHGMTEHIGRYGTLAEHLAQYGIAAAGFDLRGHGRTPGNPDCASFGEGGWEASLEDMHLFYGLLSERFPGLPHFMLGFSLGSFLVREYPCRYDDPIAGMAVLGTGHQPSPVLSLMMRIVKSEIAKAGFDSSTPLVKKLSFDTYNGKFRPTRTDFDWLCSDENELNSYISDPLCSGSISAGLFYDLLASMKRTGSKDAYRGWRRNMPVLLLSGSDDPVGDRGGGIIRVKLAMEKAGLSSLRAELLAGARHDLLHEEACTAASQARWILSGWMTDIIK